MIDATKLLEIHRELNRSTAELGDYYAPHREHVMRLVRTPTPAPGARLLVLGAGNCNDLDLPAAAAVFAEIHLVDLDGEALDAAIERQAAAEHAITLHPGVDLLSPDPAVPSGPFEVVVSACVLTQLLHGLVSLTPPHDLDQRLLSERNRHLHLLASRTACRGRAVLITDVISSLMRPDLIDCPEPQLQNLLMDTVALRNFFTGTNPVAIEAVLRNDPGLGARILDLVVSPPWRWFRGEDYSLVYALSLTLS